MSPSIRDLAVRWREAGHPPPPRLPDRESAIHRARELLATTPCEPFVVRSEVDKDTLHALAWIARADSSNQSVRARVKEILTGVIWPNDNLLELTELTSSIENPDLLKSRVQPTSAHPVPSRRRRSGSAQALSRRLLSSIRKDRIAGINLHDQPRTWELIAQLAERVESAPSEGRLVCERLIKVLQSEGVDARVLAELTLVSAMATRLLHRLRESADLLDRAEALFSSSGGSPQDMARARYQRLTLAIEERDVPIVIREADRLAREFEESEMWEWSLKSRYLEAVACRELGRFDLALLILQKVLDSAREKGVKKLVSFALVGMAGSHADQGDAAQAMYYVSEAERALAALPNRIVHAKLYWALGTLFRGQGRSEEAERTLRAAMRELHALDLPAEVAAIRLVLAELLLTMGRQDEGERELRAALPIIGEYEMVPEGLAAVSLLRDSLRRRNVDRKALTSLQEFFQRRRS